MSLKKFFSLFLLLTSQLIFCQDFQEFVGAIKLNDTSVITYKLKFKVENEKISGFSLTDIGGNHETKSTISGTYTNKELSFKETDIIYTKSNISQKDFCHIHFEPTRYRVGKTNSMKGNFKGYFSDGQKCLDGELYLNSVAKVEKRMERVKRFVNRSKRIDDTIKQKINNLKLMEKTNVNVLKKSQITSLYTNSNKIALEVYDGGQEDGDVINIIVDGKTVLRNKKITTTKELIEIQINNKVTNIEIFAVSVGEISTNTAIIEISDDINDIKAMTNLKKGEITTIRVLKK